MQWGDEEEAISEAVDMCPVDCISFVKRRELALLEYVMKSCQREDPALMARRSARRPGPGLAARARAPTPCALTPPLRRRPARAGAAAT